MPYAESTRAECHPDRVRKTARGECDTCYRRRRYREDPEVREATRRRNLERYRANSVKAR